MSALLDAATAVLIVAGLGFYLAGTIGLLRFPDVHSRLHALTKADNLGLGLVALGLALQAPGLLAALKIGLVWALALVAAATSAQLIARAALPALPGDGPDGGTGDGMGGAARR